MTGTGVLRGDALRIPLRDETVDLIVTSPPYFALRSYRDDGEHFDGQIGSEPTPQEFLQALWRVTAECWRVLKPSGSMFVNLGDKRVNTAGQGNPGTGRGAKMAATYMRPPKTASFGRPKSKMLLPHRYAIGCEDGHADPHGIGWIVRSDMVWDKPNGLPESVRDRTRDSHEYWFHLCKQERYYSAVDLIRQPHAAGSLARDGDTYTRARPGHHDLNDDGWHPGSKMQGRETTIALNPLGALPGSVWRIPSEPLTVPDHLGVDHFAAFPSEWPRRLILGWSPSGVCTACGEGRRVVVEKELVDVWHDKPPQDSRYVDTDEHGNGRKKANNPMMQTFGSTQATVTGEACACPAPDAPTRPAVILDPFGGTGTTAAVARALGRLGVSLDLSMDYSRLAKWRIFESGTASRARTRTNQEAQGVML